MNTMAMIILRYWFRQLQSTTSRGTQDRSKIVLLGLQYKMARGTTGGIGHRMVKHSYQYNRPVQKPNKLLILHKDGQPAGRRI